VKQFSTVLDHYFEPRTSVASAQTEPLRREVSHTIPKSLIGNSDHEVVNSWLGEFADVPSTFRAYRKEVTRYLYWAHEVIGKGLPELNRADIETYREFMRNPPSNLLGARNGTHADGTWKPFEAAVSLSSQRYALVVLGSLHTYLVDGGYAIANPIALIRRKGPRSEPNREKTIDKASINRLLEFLRKRANAAVSRDENLERQLFVCTWLFETGCRRDELAHAKLSDVYPSPAGLRWQIFGKGGSEAWIPLREGARNALLRYHNLAQHIPAKLPVLKSLRGKAECLKGDQVRDIVKNACQTFASESSINKQFALVTPHWFRHAITAHLLNQGTDIRYVQRFLRHKSISTTMAYDSTGSKEFELAVQRQNQNSASI
jgi:integrase/recombinase XerC